MCIGVVSWTIMEYTLHRFVFHGEELWLPNNKYLWVFHFCLHGIHHAFPMDRFRLVFPVLPGYILLIVLFTPLYAALTPAKMYPAIIAGSIFGYMFYDVGHFFM